jgi:probable HAF family extracellular repeat protein
MILRSRFLVSCIVVVEAFAGSAIASETMYHVTDLAPLAGDVGSFASAIADVGSTVAVAGRSWEGSGGIDTPAIWYNGSPTPTSFLASIPGASSGSIRAIDGDGDIAGGGPVDGAGRAFYLPSGAQTGTVLPVLGTTGGDFTAAAGVNNAGQVVGVSSCDSDNGYSHAFVWTSAGGMTDLGGFPGAKPNVTQLSLSSAAAVNSSGQIVGMSYTASGNYDPAMWTYNGSSWTITDLNPTHSVCHGKSYASAVNQFGDAVGSGFASGGIAPTINAVLFKHDGTVVVLPGLGSSSPSDAALAINDSGTVVGEAATTAGIHAFVYDSTTGAEGDLNNLIVPDGSSAGWTLQNAYGIDDAGRIAGYGTLDGAYQAFLLTPVLPGDANEDGKVDINDLTIVLTNYGQTGASWNTGDFIGDGTVDINDLTIVLTNYGDTSGSSAAGMAAVPEPASLVLLVVCGVFVALGLARRRRP